MATMISGLTCLWDSRATNSMINIKHTKYYEHNMRSIKLEYSTSIGLYYTTHGVKITLFIREFSISKIIDHRFHVNDKKGELVIGYDIIIVRDLMVKLGLTSNLNRQLPQWDGITVSMKEPRGLLGKSDLTSREMRVVVT